MRICKSDRILRLYYEEHLLGTEIAELVDVSSTYISRIIKTDNRYLSEKELRRDINHTKRLQRKKRYMIEKREAERREYIQMKKTHWKDVGRLSRMY